MAMPKTETVEIEGIQCTVFTEVRSIRLGHDARATRQTHITVLANGREVATASSKVTALARARKVLSK